MSAPVPIYRRTRVARLALLLALSAALITPASSMAASTYVAGYFAIELDDIDCRPIQKFEGGNIEAEIITTDRTESRSSEEVRRSNGIGLGRAVLAPATPKGSKTTMLSASVLEMDLDLECSY